MGSKIRVGAITRVPFFINATDLAAKTPQYLVSPVDGYVRGLDIVNQVAIVTGGVIKVQVSATNVAALADVPGATITVANAAVVGNRQLAEATEGTSGRKVSKGDLLAINLAAFTGGGAINGHISINESNDPSPAVGY